MLSENPRIQAIQLSGIIVAVLVVGGFGYYQSAIVPDQIRSAEITHNQEVQTQLQTLRNAIVSQRDGGRKRSVTVSLGTRYPGPLPLSGAGEASGWLRTIGTANRSVDVSLHNVAARGEVGDFLNGTRSYPTGMLVYQPEYNQYRSAPATVFAHGLLYTLAQSGVAGEGPPRLRPALNRSVVSGQPLVSGNRISILLLDGALERHSVGSTTITVRPRSVSTRTIEIGNNGSGPVTITLPTWLGRAQWLRTLGSETTSYGGHITRVSTRSLPGTRMGQVRITLERGQSYELRVTQVGVGTTPPQPGARYLVPVAGTNATVPEGGTREVTVEARDRFHNPVSGVRIAAGELATEDVVETNERGRATFTVAAPENINGPRRQPTWLNVSFVRSPARVETFDASTPANASVRLWIGNSDGSRNASGVHGVYAVDWRSRDQERIGGQAPCTPVRCRWDVGADPDGELELGVDIGAESYDDLDVRFTVNDTSVATVDPAATRLGGNRRATTRVVANDTGVVRIRATAEGRSDTLVLRLTNVSSLVTGPSLQLVDGSGRVYRHEGTASRVSFGLWNTSPNLLNVQSISFVDTSATNVTGVRVWNLSTGRWASEVFFNVSTGTSRTDSEDGYVNSIEPWRLGNRAILNNQAQLEPGSRMQVYINRFIDNQGDPVDMTGETITMRIGYTTGSGREASQTVTVRLDG